MKPLDFKYMHFVVRDRLHDQYVGAPAWTLKHLYRPVSDQVSHRVKGFVRTKVRRI